MAKKLYVGNLPYSTSAEELREIFESEVGPVEEAIIIKNKDTNKSKGFGFVTMCSDGDATNAIENCNNKTIDNRPLTISWAKEKRR